MRATKCDTQLIEKGLPSCVENRGGSDHVQGTKFRPRTHHPRPQQGAIPLPPFRLHRRSRRSDRSERRRLQQLRDSGEIRVIWLPPWYGDRDARMETVVKLRKIAAEVWLTSHEQGIFTENPGDLWDAYLQVIKGWSSNIPVWQSTPPPAGGEGVADHQLFAPID